MYYKIHDRTLVTVIFLFLCSSLVFAQKFNPQRLSAISDNQITISDIQKERVLKYLNEHGYDKKSIDLGGGRKAILKDVLNNVPQYISTYNLQARKTTGVEHIQSPSGLDLNLTGNGLTVGVWDGGQVLDSHIEFDARVINKNVADFSNHATHVSGTLIAAGINESAKGMVSDANIINYYAFEDDLGPMAMEAANGLILSNHSYGLILGWSYDSSSDSWGWYGGSGDVDERFGYYSQTSKTIDEIAYNAPYYTIVWAAGNDRNDAGDGSKSPDGPYNIIGPAAASKNVITVGAISGFDQYVNDNSIVMSSFSSWGPTDDGRIKPDIVADGVDLLSTSASGIESYTIMSGTSMAAPNVTGTLAVLQQYYRQNSDTFLTSASLKSLIIHSAREAGISQGPDMVYGWGVLNAVDALKIINNNNSKDTLLIDSVLFDQEVIEFELFSDGTTPITATLVWTDFPGEPGVMGEDHLLLQNDLDIRLIDDEGLEVLPWIMVPGNPLIAEKGDNFRDNIEKIEFANVQPRKYKLLVSHKSTLINLEQSFGLTITGGAIVTNEQSEYYWTSSSGELLNASNWALISGGSSVSSIELSGSTVVFDNNSMLVDGGTITLTDNLTVENFIWLSDKQVTLDLGGDTLAITGQFKVDKNNLNIRNGVIKYVSNESDLLSLNFDGLDDLEFIINTQRDITITSNIDIYGLKLWAGKISIMGKNISLSNLEVHPNVEFILLNNSINVYGDMILNSDLTMSNLNFWKLQGGTISGLSAINFDDVVEVDGETRFIGNFHIQKLINNGQPLSLFDHLTIDSLIMNEGSKLFISDGDTVEINKHLDIKSTSTNLTSIIGENANNASVLQLNYRKKLCFEYLVLTNMKLIGESVVNVELNGILSNTTNFDQKACDEILFPDFEISNFCSNSVVNIIDLSEGNILDYEWEFGSGIFLGTNDFANPSLYFNSPGFYELSLNVSNDIENELFSVNVEIQENLMAEVEIIENSSGLVSTKEGDEYQWFLDGVKLDGKNERTLTPTLSGNYQVSYYLYDSSCLNRISPPSDYLVTGLNNELSKMQGISLFPNPFENKVSISGASLNDRIIIYDITGKVIMDSIIFDKNFDVVIEDGLIGYYLITIIGKNKVYQNRLLKLK